LIIVPSVIKYQAKQRGVQDAQEIIGTYRLAPKIMMDDTNEIGQKM
jgi:hypothetical protein